MSRIAQLEALVAELYEQKLEGRAEWADWLYKHHVFVVADYASKLAAKYHINPELPRAGALLHDCADAVMLRLDERHTETTYELSRSLLEKSGFTSAEITLIVDDAIAHHSCRDGQLPASMEGKVLAVADAFAHFKTDYYLRAVEALLSAKSLDEAKQWVLKKIDRDYHDKIPCLPDEVSAIEHDYQLLKELFSR